MVVWGGEGEGGGGGGGGEGEGGGGEGEGGGGEGEGGGGGLIIPNRSVSSTISLCRISSTMSSRVTTPVRM